jgi:hypothetical protein
MNVLHESVEPGLTPSAGLTEAGDAARGQGSIVHVASIASGVTAVGVTQLHFAARSLRFGLTGLLRPSKSEGVDGLVN